MIVKAEKIEVTPEEVADKIKEMADFVTISNNEAGVAFFINNYILK